MIVCAYNYERFLPEALDSVLAQDHPSFEVDRRRRRLHRRHAGRHRRYGDAVRGIRRANGGLNAATTTGIEAARGRLPHLHRRRRQLAARRACRACRGSSTPGPRSASVWGDMDVVDERGRVKARSCTPLLRPGPRSGRLLGPLLAGNYISAGSLMVRAALRDRFHPIDPIAPYQDWWIATQVAA